MTNEIIQIDQFDFPSFCQEHYNDYIALVHGSWHYKTLTGSYECLMLYQKHEKRLKSELNNLKSSNVAMILGIQDVCQQLKKTGQELYVLVPTSLGFNKALQDKGVNSELIRDVFNICEKKEISLHVITLESGGRFIKNQIEGKYVKTEIVRKDQKNSSVKKNGYLSPLSDGCVEYVLGNEPNLYHSIMAVLSYQTFAGVDDLIHYYLSKYREKRPHLLKNRAYVREVAELCWHRYFEEGVYYRNK